jgi:hypothetical protein
MMRIPVDDTMRLFLTPSQHGNNELRQEQRTAHRLGARVTLLRESCLSSNDVDVAD